ARESEHDPSAARREDESAQPGQERPQQASGALGGEVERQAQAEEAIGRPDDAQVRRANFQDLGIGGAKTAPSCSGRPGGPAPSPPDPRPWRPPPPRPPPPPPPPPP